MFNRKKDVLNRWTGYGSELYNHEGYGNNADLTAISSQEEDIQTMLREEVEISSSTEKRRRLSKLIIYQQRGDHDQYSTELWLGRVALWIRLLTQELEVPGSIPGLAS